MFVIPSIIIGYSASIPALHYIYSFMFKNQTLKLSPLPTPGATVQAVVLGLVIPIISSVLPIQSALNKNLNESINNSRSKTKGQKVEVTNADSFK